MKECRSAYKSSVAGKPSPRFFTSRRFWSRLALYAIYTRISNECSDSMRPRPELSPVSAGRSLFASFD